VGMEQPIYYWDPSIAPSGMAFYTGDAFPAWRGKLFVGSLKFGLLGSSSMARKSSRRSAFLPIWGSVSATCARARTASFTC
jgi:hypothetical protein